MVSYDHVSYSGSSGEVSAKTNRVHPAQYLAENGSHEESSAAEAQQAPYPPLGRPLPAATDPVPEEAPPPYVTPGDWFAAGDPDTSGGGGGGHYVAGVWEEALKDRVVFEGFGDDKDPGRGGGRVGGLFDLVFLLTFTLASAGLSLAFEALYLKPPPLCLHGTPLNSASLLRWPAGRSISACGPVFSSTSP